MNQPNALDLFKPWIDCLLSDAALNPQANLKAFQDTLPGRLPDDYAAVLMALSQAVLLVPNRIEAIEMPLDPQHPIGPGLHPELSTLYGLGGEPSDPDNIALMWSLVRVDMPKGFIPIGASIGDQICMDLSDLGHGRIYYWFREGNPGPSDARGCPGRGNTFLLAYSFTDLCARIRLPAAP